MAAPGAAVELGPKQDEPHPQMEAPSPTDLGPAGLGVSVPRWEGPKGEQRRRGGKSAQNQSQESPPPTAPLRGGGKSGSDKFLRQVSALSPHFYTEDKASTFI